MRLTNYERRMRRIGLIERQGGLCARCAKPFKSERYASLIGDLMKPETAAMVHLRCPLPEDVRQRSEREFRLTKPGRKKKAL